MERLQNIDFQIIGERKTAFFIHLVMAIFIAATSYYPVTGSLGIAGYVAIVCIIDANAYLLGASWMYSSPGDFWSGKFWGCVILTAVSTGISVYGATMTAENLGGNQEKIIALRKEIADHKLPVDTYNHKLEKDYNKAVKDEKDRVNNINYHARTLHENQIKEKTKLRDENQAKGWQGGANRIQKEIDEAIDKGYKITEPGAIHKGTPRKYDQAFINQKEAEITKLEGRIKDLSGGAQFLELGLFLAFLVTMFSKGEGDEVDNPLFNGIGRLVSTKTIKSDREQLIELSAQLSALREELSVVRADNENLSAELSGQTDKVSNLSALLSTVRADKDRLSAKLSGQTDKVSAVVSGLVRLLKVLSDKNLRLEADRQADKKRTKRTAGQPDSRTKRTAGRTQPDRRNGQTDTDGQIPEGPVEFEGTTYKSFYSFRESARKNRKRKNHQKADRMYAYIDKLLGKETPIKKLGS